MKCLHREGVWAPLSFVFNTECSATLRAGRRAEVAVVARPRDNPAP